MGTQALNSEVTCRGLMEILLANAELYEVLRGQAGELPSLPRWARLMNNKGESRKRVISTSKPCPALTRAAVRVGLAHNRASRLQDALRAYRRAIEIDPTDWSSREQLANLYLRIGDRKAAIAEYELIKIGAPAIAARVFDESYK